MSRIIIGPEIYFTYELGLVKSLKTPFGGTFSETSYSSSKKKHMLNIKSKDMRHNLNQMLTSEKATVGPDIHRTTYIYTHTYLNTIT